MAIDEQLYDFSESIFHEVDFYILIFLLDYFKYYKERPYLNFSKLLKVDYIKSKYIHDYVYGNQKSITCAEDTIFKRVLELNEDFDICSEIYVRIIDPHFLIDNLLESILLKEKNGIKEIHSDHYYPDVLEKAVLWKNKNQIKSKYEVNSFRDKKKIESHYGAFDYLSSEEISNELKFILYFLPNKITIHPIDIDKETIEEINQMIKKYLYYFSNDQVKDDKDLYYSEQYLEFSNFIKNNFKIVNNHINIPFNSIIESKFSVLKILKFLEFEKKIILNDWVDDNVWNVEILDSTIKKDWSNNKKESLINEIKKITLYWDEKNKLFKINGTIVDISKSTHQFDILKILFEEQPLEQDLSFKELYDFLDPSGSLDLQKATKRYSNATNQLNNKIQKITRIESLFQTTRQLVRFNSKYNFDFKIIN